jgi:hypothetical protein
MERYGVVVDGDVERSQKPIFAPSGSGDWIPRWSKSR